MRSATRFLVRLYPAGWRERYGEEFEALIEDSAPGSWPVLDVMKGAFVMQVTGLSFPKLSVVLSLAGVICGLGVSMLMPPVYESTAELQLSPATAGSSHARGQLSERIIQLEQ